MFANGLCFWGGFWHWLKARDQSHSDTKRDARPNHANERLVKLHRSWIQLFSIQTIEGGLGMGRLIACSL